MANADEIAECFEIFDRAKAGKIEKNVVGTAIRALGKNPTNEELSKLLEGKADQIDLATFTSLYQSADVKDAVSQEQPMIDAFKALDKDGTGKIDAAQLRQILATLGDVLSSDEIDNLFKEVSVSAEGLDYAAFAHTLVHSYSLSDRPPPFKE